MSARGPHPAAALPDLADALSRLAVVFDATHVPKHPGGPAIDVSIELWACGLPPIVVETANQYGARVRRVEPRGKDLPLCVLIR